MSQNQGDVLMEETVSCEQSSDQPSDINEAEQKKHELLAHKSSSASSGITKCDKGCELRETTSGPECDVLPVAVGDEEMAEALKSFVLAVHTKYKDDSVLDAVDDVLFVPKTGPVKVTSSGFIVLPKQVSMSGCEISVAGDPALIKRMCQKVHELDLMENHISKWEEVFAIVQCIPNLTFLNLTKNHMSSSLPDLCQWTLPSLTHLVLNDTLVSWDVLINLLQVFPALEELHLSVNNFESVKLTSESNLSTQLSSYPTLLRLFFIGNKVTQWSELSKLGQFFPSLDFLMLSETSIESLGTSSEIQASFPLLSVLGMKRTSLKSWEEIEKLRYFPKLIDVRLNGIDFLESLEVKFKRSHTIALLPNISLLNGSPVSETEREDAERAFIRLYMDSSEKPSRFFELEQQYGQLDPLVNIDLTPINSVKLLVKVEDAEGVLKSSEVMDIDVCQSIKELKKFLSNIAGCPPSKFKLFYRDPDYFGLDKLMRLERKVYSYNMKEGDGLIIYLKNA